MPNISVIIPTYNREQYICETIDSVLKQITRDDEVIVVDDGSTDSTASRIESYGSRIQYVRQANSFLANARNHGLRIAKGEFVMFLDSDDVLHDSAIPRLRKQLGDHPECVLAFGPAVGFSEQGPLQLSELRNNPLEDETLNLTRGNFIRTAGCVLIRTSAIRNVGAWDTRLPGVEDWDMWIRLSLIAPFSREREPVLNYRVHASSMSRNNELMTRSSGRVVLKHSRLCSHLRKNPLAWEHLRGLRTNVLKSEWCWNLARIKTSLTANCRLIAITFELMISRDGQSYIFDRLRSRFAKLSSR